MKRVNRTGVFFKIMGLDQTERDDIWLRIPRIKEAMQQKRQRKRQEQKLINMIRWAHKMLPGKGHLRTKGDKQAEQIQNGFNIAKKWKKEQIYNAINLEEIGL